MESQNVPHSEPKKKGRTMSPEMLEKLSRARALALQRKKELKEGGDQAKLEHLQKKMDKVKVSTEPLPSHKEPVKVEEPVKVVKKEKKKKIRQIVIEESSSSSEEEETRVVYVKKKKERPIPAPREELIHPQNYDQDRYEYRERRPPPVVRQQPRQVQPIVNPIMPTAPKPKPKPEPPIFGMPRRF